MEWNKLAFMNQINGQLIKPPKKIPINIFQNHRIKTIVASTYMVCLYSHQGGMDKQIKINLIKENEDDKNVLKPNDPNEGPYPV